MLYFFYYFRYKTRCKIKMFTTYRTVVESLAGYLTTFNKNQTVVSQYTEIPN